MKPDMNRDGERRRRWWAARWLVRALAMLALALPTAASALTVQPPFDQAFLLVDLGVVPNVPRGYGGITTTFPIDPDWIIIGGAADTPAGQLYANQMTRDSSGHMAAFNPVTLPYAAGPGVYAGLAHGPGPDDYVIFHTNQANELRQVARTRGIKIEPLSPFLSAVVASVGFLPESGPSKLKYVTRSTGQWGTLAILPDGAGTYDVMAATPGVTLGGDLGGFAYVPAGSFGFPNPSILVSDLSAHKIVTYELSASGDPIPGTRRDFLTDFEKPMGIARDPLTGDYLLTDYDGRVLLARSLPPPVATPTPVPIPTASPAPAATPTSAVAECAPDPLANCAVSGKATVLFQGSASNPRKQKVLWRWSKGSALPSDFGNPRSDTTNYRMCLYDDGALRLGLSVAAGGTCDGKPCWKASRSGLKFQAKSGNDDGVTQLVLHPGAGKASILLLGKGARLASPFPLADAAAITVQLVKNPGAGSECWSTTFPAPARTYDPRKLKLADKAP